MSIFPAAVPGVGPLGLFICAANRYLLRRGPDWVLWGNGGRQNRPLPSGPTGDG